MFLRKPFFLSLIAAALIFAAGAIKPIRTSLIDGLSLPLLFFSYASRHIQGMVFYYQNLIENERLKQEIGLIQRQQFEAEELYRENMRLRRLLDFKEKSVYPLTAAKVIGYDPSQISSIIVINKGRSQGILAGNAVITNDGLVGRIIELGESTSKVLMINDINSGVAALIQRSRQKGLATGRLGGSIALRYLPADADVEISDLVVTSGLGGLFPKGILIGQIKQIRQEDSPLEKLALIQPSVELDNIEEVLVVCTPR